jgi:hypothetical protein
LLGLRDAAIHTNPNPSAEATQPPQKNHQPQRHRGTEKSEESKNYPGFLAFDFLCVLSASVANGFQNPQKRAEATQPSAWIAAGLRPSQ